MLEPREGRGEVVLGFMGVWMVPGEGGGWFRGERDEDEGDREGGSELRSGDMSRSRDDHG